MSFPYFQLYLLPIVVTFILVILSYPVGAMLRLNDKFRYFSQYWHVAVWLCILSHFGVRGYYLWRSPSDIWSYLTMEFLVTVLVVSLWLMLNLLLLRPKGKEFYEAEILIRWIQMSESIMPRRSISLHRVGANVFPHTRGCEEPCFCISKELLSSLSENGQNYLFAHFLYHIKENHHRYKRLFNFCFVCQWYNPLLHVMSVHINRDFNQITDQLTLEHFGRSHAGNYGLTLIHTFESHEPMNPVMSKLYRKATTKHLKWRIGRMN